MLGRTRQAVDQKASSNPAYLPLRWLALVVLIVSALLIISVRARLFDFPLERDEGEYAYLGQLILGGFPPYELASNMKMPGIYLAYAAIMAVFGQTAAGIHLGLLLVHLMTLGILFLVARHFLDLYGAAIAVIAYGMMILSPSYLGLAGHATHFVVLPALAGTWILLKKNGRLSACFVAGFLFGIAFLMKQTGAIFGCWGGIYLIWTAIAERTGWRRIFARAAIYSA
ncbi:MAG TPA: glycosyltransferase family 39 protein, partial [Pseudomonadales bacterium]|nr:glycosyltransferase family 39 protein [Pseudomonadales bacterium]